MGWSLRELGERVGCHAQNVSAVESNRSHPQLASLARYARAFGIPIRLLVLTAEGFGKGRLPA
jgi:transcriptional regulator with XRE-family HTH domain